MRYAFIETLTAEAEKNKDIVLLTADLGFSVFEKFKKKFPDRFINVGVAEQNMMSIAAGLGMAGKIVFAYSIATFATTRPFEQIRNDIASHGAPVVIVGSGSGLSYGNNAFTHHATEDISLMRSIPGMVILSPSDPLETIWATHVAIKLRKPVYLRLGKSGEKNLSETSQHLKFGMMHQITKGSDMAILSTGPITEKAIEVVKILKKNNISSSIFSVHTLKPIDSKLVKKLAKDFALIVTVEEHSIIGGLGSIVAEIISEGNNRSKLLRLGIPDKFIFEVGSQEYLRRLVGLTKDDIAKSIIEVFERLKIKK